MPTTTREELAFQLRKVAEAWWKIAEAVELGDQAARDRLVALDAVTRQAALAADAALEGM